jgi:hypothetical protein
MCEDILLPGGTPLGQAGSSADIRELPGGIKDAQEMFDNLTKEATPVAKPLHPGQLFRLPGGGMVGMRPISKSGPPTIDVNIPGIPIRKIKFI